MANKATVFIEATGTKDVLKAFDDIGDKGESSFASIGKEAAKTGAIITGIFVAAAAAIKPAVERWKQFEKGMQQARSAFKGTNQEFKILQEQLKLLGTSELASLPGYFEDVGEALEVYLSSGGEAAFAIRDVTAAGKYAAAQGKDLTSTMTVLASVTDSWNLSNGEAAKTLNLLRNMELQTNKPTEQLAKGMERTAGVANQYNLSMEQAAGFTAAWASSGNRATSIGTTLAMVLEKINEPLDEYLRKVASGEITGDQLVEMFGATTSKYVSDLALQMDVFDGVLADQAGNVDTLSASWTSYQTTLSAASAKTKNEGEARLLELGEQMADTGHSIEILQQELEVGFAEFAGFMLKNKELVVGAVLAIKGVIMAFQASNPLGWILAIAGALIGLFGSIESVESAALRQSTATRELAETQLASVKNAKEQIAAQRAEAEAAGATTEAINDLTDSYNRLADAELAAERNLISTTVLEQQAQAMVDIADIANELYRGAAAERAGQAQVQSYLDQLDSIEKIQIVQQELADERSRFLSLSGHQEKQENAIREAIEARYGIEVDSTLNAAELLDQYERLSTTIDGQIGTLQSRNLLEGNNLEIIRAQEKVAGFLVDADEAGVRALIAKLETQREIINARAVELDQLYWAGQIAGTLPAAVARAYQDASGNIRNQIDMLTGAIADAEGALGRVRDEGVDGTTVGAAGADGKTREEELLNVEKRGKEDSLAYVDGWIAAMQEKDKELSAAVFGQNKAARTEAIDEAATEYEQRMAKASMALASTFSGIFTDESFNFWDNFGKRGMKELENLLAWAVANGIFSFITGGAFGGVGSAGILGDIFGFASGGYIPATPGGQIIRVAEGGEGEWVVNQEQMQSLLTGGFQAAQAAAQLNAPRAAANNETTVNNQTVVNGIIVGDLATLDSLNQRAAAHRETY